MSKIALECGGKIADENLFFKL